MRSPRRCRLLPDVLVMIIVGVGFASRGMAQSPVSPIDSLKTENRAEFHKQVGALRDSLVLDLRSPGAREDLVRQVREFLHFRSTTHPLNYEQDQKFREGLDKTYKSFVMALSKIDLSHLQSLDLEELEAVAFQAYKENSESFDKSIGTKRAPGELIHKDYNTMPQSGSTAPASPPVIRRAMLAFSLIVYATDREQWHIANQSSHFWPWCRTAM
jgi:hypothetical protein